MGEHLEIIIYILGLFGLGAAGRREGKRIENRITKLETKKPKRSKKDKSNEKRIKYLEKNCVTQEVFDNRVEKKERESREAIAEINERLRHIEASLDEFKEKVFERFMGAK